jgi:hypothetical protein
MAYPAHTPRMISLIRGHEYKLWSLTLLECCPFSTLCFQTPSAYVIAIMWGTMFLTQASLQLHAKTENILEQLNFIFPGKERIMRNMRYILLMRCYISSIYKCTNIHKKNYACNSYMKICYIHYTQQNTLLSPKASILVHMWYFKIMIHFYNEHIYNVWNLTTRNLKYLKISTKIAGSSSERRRW